MFRISGVLVDVVFVLCVIIRCLAKSGDRWCAWNCKTLSSSTANISYGDTPTPFASFILFSCWFVDIFLWICWFYLALQVVEAPLGGLQQTCVAWQECASRSCASGSLGTKLLGVGQVQNQNRRGAVAFNCDT